MKTMRMTANRTDTARSRSQNAAEMMPAPRAGRVLGSSSITADRAFLLEPILHGRADFVLGSRTQGKAEKGSLQPHQRFGNELATFLIRLLFGHQYSDIGPIRAIRLDALQKLDMQDRNYGWTIEMQIKAVQH